MSTEWQTGRASKFGKKEETNENKIGARVWSRGDEEEVQNPTLQVLHRHLLARKKAESQKNRFLKKFISKKER